jgi:RNA polymerase sigma-70 factor (ECF subfamily)
VAGYLRGRGVEAADDVTSEVFLSAFASIRQFTGDSSDFRAWLFTIAHHKAVDVHRRHRPTEEYVPDGDPRLVRSAEDTALDAVVDPEIRALLGALTPDQREVLLLRVLADLSIEQVAAATGRTTGAVKQLYHRAIGTAQRVAELRADGRTPSTPQSRRGGRAAHGDRAAGPVTPDPSLTMTEM